MSRLRWLLLTLSAAVLIVPLSSPRAQVSDKAYIIGPEDVLEVQVWERKDLNQTVFVRPDGRTSLPLVGEIMVAGKTIQELQDHLAKVYEKTVQSAIVTVIVKEIKSRPVYFVGGFGRAVWFDAPLAPPVAAAALARAEAALLDELNLAHPADLARLISGRGEGWRAVGVDMDGCDLADGEAVARVAFPQPVDGPDAVRLALAELWSNSSR